MSLRDLLFRLRQRKGFTIVEMMVVVTILGFLATVSTTLVTVLFSANLRSSQLSSQQTTIENTFGFFSSRLSLVQYNNIGTPGSGTNSLDPLSLAGDQILFQSTFSENSSSATTCFRAVYLAELGEVRIASKGGFCGDNILPVRGPNSYLYGAKEPGTENNQKQFYEPGDELFDPVIDSAYPEVRAACENDSSADCQAVRDLKPWTLASGIDSWDVPNNTIEEINEGRGLSMASQGSDPENNFELPLVGGPYKNIVPMFAFSYSDGKAIPFSSDVGESWVPPLVAGAPTGGDNPLGGSGSSAGVREKIGGVSVQALVAPVAQESNYDRKRSRFYEQRYSLQQLCSIFETPGRWTLGVLDGSSYTSPQIAPGALGFRDFGSEAFPFDEHSPRETPVAMPQGGEWEEILRYDEADLAGSEEMPPGKYLVLASVLGSNVMNNNSATEVELAIVQSSGNSSEVTLAATSSGAWPLSFSTVSPNLSPDKDTIILKARARNATTIPASSQAPIRLQLQWLGPASS